MQVVVFGIILLHCLPSVVALTLDARSSRSTRRHVSKLWMGETKLSTLLPSITSLFNEKFASTLSREVIGRTYAAQKEVFVESPNFFEEYTEENITSTAAYETFSPVKSVWFRGLVVLVSFGCFPFLVALARPFADLEDVGEVTSAVLPGIGILFGTLIALTYQLLFDRQSALEDVVTQEIASLSTVANELEYIFEEESNQRREAFRCVWKQADTLIHKSRIQELLNIMNYRDPLTQLLDVVNQFTFHLEECDEEEECELAARKEQLQSTFIPSVRGAIQSMIELRSSRLHQENTALPATHFNILTLLALYQIVSFVFVVAGTLPPEETNVSFESRLAFACLTGVFTLAINFALDLNQAFGGVYQIRRSATSALLVQTFQTVRRFYSPSELLALPSPPPPHRVGVSKKGANTTPTPGNAPTEGQ